MSDSMRAIHDNIEDYLERCCRFNEKPVEEHGSPNPYCEHAKELEKRERLEDDKRRADAVNNSPEMQAITAMLKGLLNRVEEENLTALINADPKLKKWWRKNKNK